MNTAPLAIADTKRYAPSSCAPRPFRVQQNAASLKPAFPASRSANGVFIPRSTKRGLIEAQVLFRAGLPWGAIPRSTKRGLIEATVPVTCIQAYAGIPRSTKRGLIEAMQNFVPRPFTFAFRVQQNAASLKPVELLRHVAPDLSFRVQQNAASLKLCELDRAGIQEMLIPRSTKRGLIEASASTIDWPWLQPFRVQQNAASLKHGPRSWDGSPICNIPRSTKRGLIEAIFDSRYVLRPFAFRVQQNAASLKL